MRALIPMLLAVVVQKSSCDSRDMEMMATDLFGAPPADGGSTNEEVVDDNVAPCGIYRDQRIGTRIVSGTEAEYIQYPWMVALYRRRSKKCALQSTDCWRYTSAGTLINMNVVLTAAHNVHGVKEKHLKARAGDWDLEVTKELFPYQERFVKKIIIHNKYKHSTDPLEIKYDAALLVMETPYSEMDNVATICLPQQDLVYSANCKTAGWGSIKHGSTEKYEKTLKVVDLNLVDSNECSRSLSRAAELSIRLHSSFMCAGGVKGKDSCQGDGGSPLMCLVITDYYYQRGIVSWGLGCGEENVPGVYSDVAKIRNWIDDQMLLNNFNSKSYIYVPE